MLSKVRRPRPSRNGNMNFRAFGEKGHLTLSPKCDRPNITGFQPVADDRFKNGPANLRFSVRKLHAERGRRLKKAIDVFPQPKNRYAVRAFVRTYPFERAAPIMQRVA